jgi:uncharacterized phage infection (PIP) family protein YhgE
MKDTKTILASLDKGQKRLDAKLTSLDAKVTSLDAKVTSLDAKVTSLDAKVTSLDEGQKLLDKGQKRLDAKLTSLDEGQKRLEENVATLLTGTVAPEAECQARRLTVSIVDENGRTEKPCGHGLVIYTDGSGDEDTAVQAHVRNITCSRPRTC